MEAGDRAPNFILKDQRNEQFELYTSISGGPIVLVILSLGKSNTTKLLSKFEEKYLEYKAQDIDLFIVSNASQKKCSDLAKEVHLSFPLLADHNNSATKWFLSSSNTQSPVAFILDPNQRLIATESRAGKDESLPERALELAKKIVPRGIPKCISVVAPVLLIPNIFSQDQCQRWINFFETSNNAPGKIQPRSSKGKKKIIDHGIKRRTDHVIFDQTKEVEIINILGPRIGPEVSKVYHFVNWYFERLRISCYKSSDAGFFKPHRDNFNEQTKDRRYAITINLNSEDYVGGDLRFPEYGPDLYRPPTGAAIVFSCSLLHEVLPVTRGNRFVFLTFLIEQNPSST